MSFEFGENIKITIFGQSHSEAIGAVINGFRPARKSQFQRLRSLWHAARPAETHIRQNAARRIGRKSFPAL